MATVLQLRARLEPLRNKETVYELLFQVIKSLEAYLIDLNLISLEEGKDISGKTIGRYSKSTELEYLFGDGPKPIKPKIQGEPYNFQWTGGLFDGMKINFFSNEAHFTSTDSKSVELVARYGDIFGLQPKQFQEALREKIYPGFMLIIRKQIGLL